MTVLTCPQERMVCRYFAIGFASCVWRGVTLLFASVETFKRISISINRLLFSVAQRCMRPTLSCSKTFLIPAIELANKCHYSTDKTARGSMSTQMTLMYS
ncbi:hypothetical protein VNO78_07669 [Psophocarpus tetragonolobus]|uniref:Uncharacterized protein n=1 Tax=Psophocarpus tetragonolobus TaxID=3891 RepID=A0AAN9T3M8_PSOTE